MNTDAMINCQNLSCSEELARERLNQFRDIFGEDCLKRIFCLNFFLLGATRKALSDVLKIAPGTIRSFIRAIRYKGISALEDHRRKHSLFLPPLPEKPKKPSIVLDNDNVTIDFGTSGQMFKIPRKNTLQLKAVLLTLLDNGVLSSEEVAKALDFSVAHTLNLSHKLQKEDVHGLIDKRQGQKKDYKFTPEVKAEVIQQFAANVITRKPASGKALSEDLNTRCNLCLPERSIRSHLQILGLSKIKKTLPEVVDTLKKTLLDNLKHET